MSPRTAASSLGRNESELEVALDTSLFPNGLEVSEPYFTVTAKNRNPTVEYELNSFGVDLMNTDKVMWLVGGNPHDTQLPHVLPFRRRASMYGGYKALAEAVQKQGLPSPVSIRGVVVDALGDRFYSEEKSWDFSQWLE